MITPDDVYCLIQWLPKCEQLGNNGEDCLSRLGLRIEGDGPNVDELIERLCTPCVLRYQATVLLRRAEHGQQVRVCCAHCGQVLFNDRQFPADASDRAISIRVRRCPNCP
jgi:hypothetical protein